MQVRHDTSALEKALAFIAERASIPVRQAEAEALAKRSRAIAHRRLATGVAIGVAAIGIGLGLMLGFWKPLTPITSPVSPDPEPQYPAPEHPPASHPAPFERAPPPEVSKPAPSPEPPAVPQPGKPPVIDYERFATQTVSLLGKNWIIEAGHHYASDTDTVWKNAWCYTNPMVDGIQLKVDLANRPNPEAQPIGPIANPGTLAKAGLDGFSALALATKCPWLDGKSFRMDEFAQPGQRQGAIPSHEFALAGRVLTFRGEIERSFLDELKARDSEFDKLVIDSPGGLVRAAIDAGNWLRIARKSVEVDDECLSACVFVLAGGNERVAAPDARIGVHRFYSRSEDDHHNDLEVGQQMSSTIIQFLKNMGVDEELFHRMAAVPSNDMAYIDHPTLQKWNLLGGAPPASPPDQPQFVTREDYDAVGNDLPNVPTIQNVDQQSCEAACNVNSDCAAYTYNQKSSVCFLKSKADVLFNTPAAVTGYRRDRNGEPRISSMQTSIGVALLGDWHRRGVISYVDCARDCEENGDCKGFTHDTKTRQCVFFSSISGKVPDAASSSGVKAEGQ